MNPCDLRDAIDTCIRQEFGQNEVPGVRPTDTLGEVVAAEANRRRVEDVRLAQERAEAFVEERHQDQLRYSQGLRDQRDRYENALREIAGEDYRGNRPHSATVAWKALNPDG